MAVACPLVGCCFRASSLSCRSEGATLGAATASEIVSARFGYAVANFSSPETCTHSENARLVVTIVERRS